MQIAFECGETSQDKECWHHELHKLSSGEFFKGPTLPVNGRKIDSMYSSGYRICNVHRGLELVWMIANPFKRLCTRMHYRNDCTDINNITHYYVYDCFLSGRENILKNE